MNWGKGIAFALLLFGGFILMLVYKSMNQSYDLVTDDYYKQEINFQSKIDAINNTKRLKEKVKITESPGSISLFFPKDLFKDAEVKLYHIIEKKYDRNFVIQPNTHIQTLSKEKIKKGKYRIFINWQDGQGNRYFQQVSIRI